MRFPLPLLLLFALSCFLGTKGFSAARSEYSSHIWQEAQGLPQNYVQAILQDRTGYLWIGTQEGVCRFDGVQFTGKADFEQGHLVEGGSFLAFCETDDGSIWMGLEGGRVLQCRDGLIREFGASHGLPDSSIRVIEQARNGTLWFGSNHGLMRLMHSRFELFTTREGLPHNVVRAVCEDAKGRLWIGTDNGLAYYEDGRFQTVTLTNGLPRYAIRALCEDKAGNLWVALHGGLMRFRDGQASLYMKPGGHAENMITAICQDDRGFMWVGSYNGLSRFANGTFETELKDGKSYELVYDIEKDREGNLWVGTRDGLHRLSKRHFTLLTKEDGLPHNNITSLREDRNGDVWIGTWGGGLCRLQKGEPVHQEPPLPVLVYNSNNGLGSDFVLGLGEDRSGAIWVGTPYASHGLKSLKDGQFTLFGKEQGFTDIGVRMIEEDVEGNLWIGTEHGLNRFKDGIFTRITTADGLSANGIRDMYEGTFQGEPRVWLGTDAGMTRLAEGKFLHAGYSNLVVNAFFEDRDRHVWIALWGVGLVRSFEGPIAPIYCPADGLPTAMVHEMLQDDSGGLWISSRKGLHRLDKNQLNEFTEKKRTNITSFPMLLGNAECNFVAKPSAWKRQNGDLWFATSKGIAIVKPNEIWLNSNPPPVVIEAVVADGKRVQCHVPGRSTRASQTSKDITIPPGRGDLEILYTAFSYTAPEKVVFKYKLDGVDIDWVESGTRRAAFYSNMRPGNYRFRVMACNNEGVWNERGAALGLVLQPYFWQTRWFTFSSLLAAVGVIVGSTRFLTRRKMQQTLARLEQEHAIERERTRIARDMHDDLGANLTEILVLSTLTRDRKNDPVAVDAHADRIAQRTEGVIDSLHAIVWAINPRNDSLDRLVNYICEQSQSFLETSSIRCRLETPGDLPPIPLSSETRHNVFLAVKESLNNIVKHAKASEVQLRFVLDERFLQIFIADNGQGFDMSEASSSGNGLYNIEKRMSSIGGSAQFETHPKKGTKICLRMPMLTKA